MDEKDDTTRFPREPWQRLLADDGDGPPETTDARIRAAARRDLAPRGRRWWLPASLAASFVLAVFVVQSQLGTMRIPIMSDADRGEGGAINARLVERENADAARPPGRAPAAAGVRRAKAREAAETDEYGYPQSEIAADSAGAGPRVGGPERDVQAAHEMPDDLPAAVTSSELGALPPAPPQSEEPVAASASPADDEVRPFVVADSKARRADAPQEPPATTKIRPPPYEKSPEAWYAFIEKLRAQGRTEEAERQLARLEKAYPGWVERYLRDHPKP
ncbi:MAG TPA: hypothetical protein VFR77_06490 [Steroidobacteraceae bacterium]|nr:hypothetical protein [Steroidobacteraceae bacterium]